MSKLDEIKKKFEDVGIRVDVSARNATYLDKDEKKKSVPQRTLIVHVPSEREFEKLIINEQDDLEQLGQLDLEKYKFINGYNGIWSEQFSVLECEIEYAKDFIANVQLEGLMEYQFFNFIKGYTIHSDEQKQVIEFPSFKDGVKILIGNASPELMSMKYFKRKAGSYFIRCITVRIEGLAMKTHTDAITNLIKISNSVFFQIDLKKRVPLRLAINKKYSAARYGSELFKSDHDFSSPGFEYDEAPMSLYMYARASNEMPLLQYLAYYQVLEYYFPVYALKDASVRIKNFIKDPLFNVNKDADIAHIIGLIKTSSKNQSMGDERSQIKATINAIIDPLSLYSFITETNKRKDFFDQQKKSRGVSQLRLNLNSSENDLRNDVSLRIYEIRCRVVHSKEDGPGELLLPDSKDLEHLEYDLQLIEFLAQRAIIAGSRPLNL